MRRTPAVTRSTTALFRRTDAAEDGLLSRQQPPYGEFLAERCLLISPAVAADKGDLLSGWGHIEDALTWTRRNLTLAFARCALALAGSCVSPEELRREDEARCAGYGFQTGTSDFANCLQRENLARLYAALPPVPYWGYWGYWSGFLRPHCCYHHPNHRMAHGDRSHKH